MFVFMFVMIAVVVLKMAERLARLAEEHESDLQVEASRVRNEVMTEMEKELTTSRAAVARALQEQQQLSDLLRQVWHKERAISLTLTLTLSFLTLSHSHTPSSKIGHFITASS